MEENKKDEQTTRLEDFWDKYPLEKPKEEEVLERKVPQPVTWRVLKNEKFPSAQWRIKNLIPTEGLVFLASISGEGKTWVAMEIAQAITSGKDFLGHSGFKSVPGNVLYIDSEMSRQELQRRGIQIDFDNDLGLFLLNDDLNFSARSLDDHHEWLEEFIEQNEICVVIIDTFRAVAGGLKEEKAEDVREFINGFKKYKNKKVAIIFLDHCRKASHFETKIPQKEHLFGSQDKTASVEILLMIKGNDDGSQIEMYQRKNRLAPSIAPFKIKVADTFDNTGNTSTILSYDGEIEDAETKKEEAKEMILEKLKEGGMTTKQIISFTHQQKRIGEKNTREALRELRNAGEVESVKKGREDFFTLPKTPEKGDACEDGINF